MKKYEIIIRTLESKIKNYNIMVSLMLSDYYRYNKIQSSIIEKAIMDIYSKYNYNISENYIQYLKVYHCPIWGEFDFFNLLEDTASQDSLLLNVINETIDEFPTLLPIGNINNGDYLFLNEKGEVITFLEIAKDSKPIDELTEVLDDEYEDGWDVAYLKYPDKNGDYRMYWILARSFDEFMNECVFGDKYLEITESDDAFYRCVKEIRNDLGI